MINLLYSIMNKRTKNVTNHAYTINNKMLCSNWLLIGSFNDTDEVRSTILQF